MSALSCAQARDLAPEVALGVLGGGDRAEVLLHMDRCPACRAHINELAETVDALALLAPEAEPPTGFEKRMLHAMGVQRHRGWRAVLFSRWAAVAAVAGLLVAASILGTLAGLGIIGGHKNAFGSEYAETLQRMGGKSLKGAPMVAPGGKRTGDAFVYQGKSSWVFLSVDYGTMPSGTYRVMLDDAKGRHMLGPVNVTTVGQGTFAAPAPGGGTKPTALRLVDEEERLMCEARFSS
jgi:hypothetical protein